jgi:hypothetical protein
LFGENLKSTTLGDKSPEGPVGFVHTGQRPSGGMVCRPQKYLKHLIGKDPPPLEAPEHGRQQVLRSAISTDDRAEPGA